MVQAQEMEYHFAEGWKNEQEPPPREVRWGLKIQIDYNLTISVFFNRYTFDSWGEHGL